MFMMRMDDVLTAAEIAEIREANKYLNEDTIRSIVHRTASEVHGFVNMPNISRIKDMPVWRLRVARRIAETDMATDLDRKFNLTDDMVKDAIRAAAEEARKDMVEDWVYDPADFAKWHPHTKIGPDGPEGHPWGDLTVLEAWLNATPYRVWKIANTVREAVKYDMDNALVDLATGYEAPDFTRIAEAAFNKAVADFVATVTNPPVALAA